MILSDKDLRNRLTAPNYPLVISPLEDAQVQPASIDLTLDDEFHRRSIDATNPWGKIIDLGEKSTYSDEPLEVMKEVTEFYLWPGKFALGSTAERVEIPDDLCARVEGKSSLGRMGLLVHLTAGYIDPGFKGKITLEMVNVSDRPIILRPGLSICQLSVLLLSSIAECPYGHEKLNSKYQDQKEVVASRYAG